MAACAGPAHAAKDLARWVLDLDYQMWDNFPHGPDPVKPPPPARPARPGMNQLPGIVLGRVLKVMRPLVRLLVRHGVTYTTLAAALKPVFVAAAREELQRQGMAGTDSALTLLSGVHRRDVRTMRRSPSADDAPRALGLAAEVVGRWLSEPPFVDAQGQPRVLPRGQAGEAGDALSFEALVAGVSRDVRARAVLDELLRLGVVHELDAGLQLNPGGFAPRQGFEELAWLFADNLHDHAAASVANLQGDGRFLEQAVFVDQISPASEAALHRLAAEVWQQAMRRVLNAARRHFDHDAAHATPAQRGRRARFGVYFYGGPDEPGESRTPHPSTDEQARP